MTIWVSKSSTWLLLNKWKKFKTRLGGHSDRKAKVVQLTKKVKAFRDCESIKFIDFKKHNTNVISNYAALLHTLRDNIRAKRRVFLDVAENLWVFYSKSVNRTNYY